MRYFQRSDVPEEPKFSPHVLVDHHTGLYVQDFFAERIYLERKRAERSKKYFMLMLLNIEGLLEPPAQDEAIPKIASVLFSATREIDLKGWYKKDSAIGVLFSELDSLNRIKFKEHILNKTQSHLARSLTGEQQKRIVMTCHFYPEEQEWLKDRFIFDKTLYPDSSSALTRLFLSLKRATDILASLAALLIFCPILLAIAAAIRLTSDGPALFKQERIGIFGRPFTFLKFRSMYMNLDPGIHRNFIKALIKGQLDKNSEQDRIYKLTRDPRVTPFGRILRKTSLDELPQFINVLKGDMSLVGPRPPISYEFMDYDVWHRARLLSMRPGITGLWQVMGRSTTSFNEMVRLDLKYIKEWTLRLDLKILFKTPWVVIACKGAY